MVLEVGEVIECRQGSIATKLWSGHWLMVKVVGSNGGIGAWRTENVRRISIVDAIARLEQA